MGSGALQPGRSLAPLPRRPMVALFVAAACGLLGARYVGDAETGVAILLAALALCLLGGLARPLQLTRRNEAACYAFRLLLSVAVLLALLGGYWFYLASLDARQQALQERFPAGERVQVIALGTVHTAPAPLPDRNRAIRLDPAVGEPPTVRAPGEKLAFERAATTPFEARSVFELTVHEYRGGDEPWDLRNAPERIRVLTDESWPDVRHGQTLAIPLTLHTPPPAANPGEFDYGEHLRTQGISRQARWRFHHGAELIAEPSPLSLFTPRGFTAEVRRRTILFVHEQIGGTHSSLLLTLTLGIRTLLVPELRDSFAKTGTVHLLVISGLHVGILVLLLEGLMLLLRLPMRVRAVAMIGLLLLFCELTGGQVAVTRAVTMACIYYGAQLALRRADLLNVLAAAALVVVTINPHELFQTGFHLSFLAVFWLALLANRWQRREVRESAGEQGAATVLGLYVLRFGWRAGVASAVVLLGLAPLLAYNFYLVSPSSLLVNVVALPVMVVILATAIPLLLGIGLEVALGLSGLFAIPLSFLLYVAAAAQTMLLQSVFLVAQQSWSHVVTPPPHVSWIVGYQALLFAWACRERLRLPTRRLALATMLFALAVVWHAQAPGAGAASTWDEPGSGGTAAAAGDAAKGAAPPVQGRATLLHTGIGRCVVLRTVNGGTVLVDPGNQASWAVTREVIAPYLWAQGVRRLEAVVVTESSTEVSDGLHDLVQMMPVKRVLVSERMKASLDAETLLAGPRQAGVPIRGLAPGDCLEIDGSRLHVLGPRVPADPAGDGSERQVLEPDVGVMPLLWEEAAIAQGEARRGRLLLPGRSDARGLDAIWQRLDAMRVTRLDAVVLPYDRPNDPVLVGFLERLKPRVVLHGHFDQPATPYTATLPAETEVRTTGRDGAIHLAWHGKGEETSLRVRSHRERPQR